VTKTSKTLALALIASSTVLLGVATASACGPYVQQDIEQQQINRLFVRINKGSRDGSLTDWESQRLNDMAIRVENRYTRFASDGYLDGHESRRVARMIKKTSRRIHRLRNNAERVHVHYNHQRNTRFERRSRRGGLRISWGR